MSLHHAFEYIALLAFIAMWYLAWLNRKRADAWYQHWLHVSEQLARSDTHNARLTYENEQLRARNAGYVRELSRCNTELERAIASLSHLAHPAEPT